MNKFAKGAVAAAAGIVLLLGGVGSLAYWNDSADLDGVAINAGQLALSADGADWADDAITTWVPGNKNVYTADLKLTAEGDDIEGTIGIDGASYDVAAATAAGFTVAVQQDGAAKIAQGSSGAVDATDAQLSFDRASGAFTFHAPGEYTIPVKVTIELPYGTTADNSSQGTTIDFSELAFTATQGDPSN